MQQAFLSLPYDDGSAFYRGNEYFRNVAGFAGAFDHLIGQLDLPPGSIRLKQGGGEGGHNGLRSIATVLGSKDFQRVRIGIGRPPGRQDPAAFVLQPFNAAERAEVPTIVEQAADATDILVRLGLEPAQNVVHAWG